MSASDVYGRQMLTYKINRRAERVKLYFSQYIIVCIVVKSFELYNGI